MSTIYLAGPFERRLNLHPVRARLEEMGHQVTSRWLEEPEQPKGWSKSSWYWECALQDLEDLRQADILVLCTLDSNPRGGAATEYGYSLGRNPHLLNPQAIYIVGPKTSVFHELCDKQFPTWEDFYQFLPSSDTGGNNVTSNQDSPATYRHPPGTPGCTCYERPQTGQGEVTCPRA